jgi:ABC-type Fe3+/spermidine/putrescine transport system ATPase subunit
MPDTVVELRDVTRRFGAVTAVDRVSLAIEDGECFALLGPSGCGKTTTLRLIAGLERPDEGEIRLLGERANARAPWERPVSMVFQQYALFPHLDVARNVAFGLEERRRPKAEIAQRVDRALELVRLDPATYRRRQPAELSGGQRQRVALARALVLEPRILLLDEPLGALDLQLRKAMQLELRALNRSLGITFVFVTHDQEEALALSDRIAVMDRARIAQVGTPAEIYRRPRTAFVAGFIGQCNVIGGVAVRPEHVALAAAGRPGEVRDVIFLGGLTHVMVRLDDGTDVTLAMASEREDLPSPGARVHVAWEAANATVLEG